MRSGLRRRQRRRARETSREPAIAGRLIVRADGATRRRGPPAMTISKFARACQSPSPGRGCGGSSGAAARAAPDTFSTR